MEKDFSGITRSAESFLRELGCYQNWMGLMLHSPASEAFAPAGDKPEAREQAVMAAAAELAEPSPKLACGDLSGLRALAHDCRRCELHKGRQQVVFGTGAEHGPWMLIGEAPGAEEDIQGQPFVGRSGRLLDKMLEAIGLSRHKNIYITNVIKCRPPANRNPLAVEINHCQSYLHEQIRLVQPKFILASGRFAIEFLLGQPVDVVGEAVGRVRQFQGIPWVGLYHPSYLLRKPSEKARAWEQLCVAKQHAQSLS